MRDILKHFGSLPGIRREERPNRRAARGTKKLPVPFLSFALRAASLWFLASPLAMAFTYADQDVLLIFRADGYSDVEFNLGSISQFLNPTSGNSVVVGNWIPEIVNANFVLTNGAAEFAVLAVTSDQDANPRAWVTDSQLQVAATNVSKSQWESGFYSVISGIGANAASDPSAVVGTNYDVLPPSSPFSFDYIASNGGQTPALLPFLGGGSGVKFRSVIPIPGSARFYELSPSGLPRSAARLVGTFTFSQAGVLSFQSGTQVTPAQISSTTWNGGTLTVGIATKPGTNYRLRYADHLGGSLTNWTILSGSIAGDGTVQALYDTTTGAGARFYRVESFP